MPMPDLALLPEGSRVFVDTNILFLHFRGHSATCTAFIDRIAAGEVIAYVNTQVLSDLLHKLMLAEAYHRGIIEKLRAVELKQVLAKDRALGATLVDYQTSFENVLAIGLKVLRITRKLLVDTRGERRNHGLMTGDSLHLGNMNRHDAPIRDIVTNDGDFAHIPGVALWQPEDVVT